MNKLNIAVIGLGGIGSAFLAAMLDKKHNFNLVCVAEIGDTPGKAQAQADGVKVVALDEIVAMGEAVDILFDLSGKPEVTRELRSKLLRQQQPAYRDCLRNSGAPHCGADRRF